MCSTSTIKSDDFGGRQIWPIFARQTTDFCWPILLADEIGQLYRSSDISLIVIISIVTMQCIKALDKTQSMVMRCWTDGDQYVYSYH